MTYYNYTCIKLINRRMQRRRNKLDNNYLTIYVGSVIN